MRNGFDPYSSGWSELGITAPQVKPTGRAANDISDSVIDISSIIARGHSKIIGHYRQLLNRDLTPAERADIEARIAREEHAWFGQQFSFNPRRQNSLNIRQHAEDCCFRLRGSRLAPNQSENYIYTKQNQQGQWVPICVSESDLATASSNCQEQKMFNADEATHVHAHLNWSEADRRAEKLDLLARYTNASPV